MDAFFGIYFLEIFRLTLLETFVTISWRISSAILLRNSRAFLIGIAPMICLETQNHLNIYWIIYLVTLCGLLLVSCFTRSLFFENPSENFLGKFFVILVSISLEIFLQFFLEYLWKSITNWSNNCFITYFGNFFKKSSDNGFEKSFGNLYVLNFGESFGNRICNPLAQFLGNLLLLIWQTSRQFYWAFSFFFKCVGNSLDFVQQFHWHFFGGQMLFEKN